MKKINLRAFLCAILVPCLLTVNLSACVEKPSGENGRDVDYEILNEDFKPAKDDGENSELGSEYRQYADPAEGERNGFSVLTEADIEYEEIDGKIRITEYLGEYPCIIVPDTIDGKTVVSIGAEAFAANRWLCAVILPDSVETIESLGFYGCNYLVYVSLGEGIKTVESYSFANCSSLFSLDLSGVESIGLGALYGCEKMNNITLSFVGGGTDETSFLGYIFGAETVDHNAEFVPYSLRRVTLSEGCQEIPDRAFSNCKYITDVIIPDSLVSIGVRAFYKCRSVVGIDVGKGTESVGDDAFFYCDSLKRVTFGDSLAELGMQAFFACSSLDEVVLPASLDEIKPSTFYGCSSLVSIDLANVKTVGKDAFYKCDSLIPPDTTGVHSVAEGNDKLFKIEQDTE